MKLRIEQFKESHFDQSLLIDRDQDYINRHLNGRTPIKEDDIAWTVFAGDEPFLYCGAFPCWNGVLEVYQFVTKRAAKRPKLFVKACRAVIDTKVSVFKPHRIQTHSVNDALHDRWMRAMKFEKEGVLRKWGPDGQDFAIWGRLV